MKETLVIANNPIMWILAPPNADRNSMRAEGAPL